MIEKLNQQIEKNYDAMVADLQGLVKIPSVAGEPKEHAPYGENSRAALQYVLDLGKRLGFDTVENVNDRTCYVEYGKGSKVVAVFAHLDVVPEGEGWTFPPYGAQIHDNRIYGRGVVDNKGPFMASLYGLYAIKQLGLDTGDWRIRVVGGTDEERGMSDMKDYLEHCGAPDTGFTPDGIYPMSFTERGINYYYMSYPFTQSTAGAFKVLSLNGGKTLNMVPDKAYAVFEAPSEEEADKLVEKIAAFKASTGMDLTGTVDGNRVNVFSKGKVSHSNAPQDGKNAVVQILMFLAEQNLGGSLGAFLEGFTEKIGLCVDGSRMGIYREDDCGKVTFNVSKMDLDEKGLTWVVNIRFPYTYKDEVTEDFKAQMEPMGVVFDVCDIHPNYCYPRDSVLIRTLRRVYEEHTGRDSTPGNEGGTYAKVIPNIIPFGSIFPENPDMCHKADEYVSLDEYLLNAKIFANAMYELTQN